MYIWVSWGGVHAHTHMRSCTGLQECMASAQCLEMEPLTAKSCRLPPHRHAHTCTDVQTHTVSRPLNLSVTGRLWLREKHTFQNLRSGRESRVEKSKRAAGTVRGEQGAKEERLFRILRRLSDLMCICLQMVSEGLSVL